MPDTTSGQRPALLPASQVAPQQIKWLWQDRIACGQFTLIAGKPGQSKSMFTAYLAAKVSKAGGTVIFSNVEDDPATVSRPRLEAAGADLDRVYFWTPRIPDDLDALEDAIVGLGVQLVVLDPIAAHFTVRVGADQDARKAMTPLSKMLSRTGCAMVGVHHLVKNANPKGSALNAVGGASGGVTGAARAVFIFGFSPDDADERLLCRAKGNHAKEPAALAFEVEPTEVATPDGIVETARLVLLGEQPKLTANDVLGVTGAVDRGGSPAKKALAAEWLTKYLATGSMPVNELREDAIQAGFSWATIRRAADEVGIEKGRVGFGPKSHVEWRLPDGHPALLMNLPGGDDGSQLDLTAELEGLDEELEDLLNGAIAGEGEGGDDE